MCLVLSAILIKRNMTRWISVRQFNKDAEYYEIQSSVGSGNQFYHERQVCHCLLVSSGQTDVCRPYVSADSVGVDVQLERTCTQLLWFTARMNQERVRKADAILTAESPFFPLVTRIPVISHSITITQKTQSHQVTHT